MTRPNKSSWWTFAILVFGSVLFGAKGLPLYAEELDLIDAAIEEIVKGSSPKEETPNTDSEKPDPPKTETDSNGVTREERKDGVVIFTRPDRTKQYKTPDGKVVTIFPDGEVYYQEPGKKPIQRPPLVDSPPSTGPRSQPSPPPPLDPEEIKPPESFPRITLPESDKKHAPWLDPDFDPRLPHSLYEDHRPGSDGSDTSGRTNSGHLVFDEPSNNRTLGTSNQNDREGGFNKYIPPAEGAEDKERSRSQTSKDTLIVNYESGARQILLPDGSWVTVYPGSDQVRVTKPGGEESVIKADDDGGVRLKAGGVTMMFDPGTGNSFLEYDDGVREVISGTGQSTLSDPGGGKEWRNEDGKPIRSEITNPEGYKIVQDSDDVAIVYKDDKPVGMGIPNGRYGYEFRDSQGNIMTISELVDKQQYSSTRIGRQTRRTAFDQPPKKGNYVPPVGPTIFDINGAILQKLQQEGRLNSVPPKAREKLDLLDEVGEKLPTSPEAKGKDELDKALELVRATLAKSELESELKRNNERLLAQKARLETEKKRVDSEKVDLLLRETRANNMKKEAEADQLSLSVQENGLMQLEIVLKGQNSLLKQQEEAIQKDLAKALREVDYTKYHDCPNKEPWKECGHADIKKKWLNQQLLPLLGPARVAQIKKLSAQRADLNTKLKELGDKKKSIEEKKKSSESMLTRANDQLKALKDERAKLDSSVTPLEDAVNQAQKQVEEQMKQIAEMEEIIKKSTRPAN